MVGVAVFRDGVLEFWKNWFNKYRVWKSCEYGMNIVCQHVACLDLRPWQTRTHCCGHILAHHVSWAAQTGKHLVRTQNVSKQTQKHFLRPGHKICVRNKCCARGKTGKHLCRQQCVRNNVSSFARAFSVRDVGRSDEHAGSVAEPVVAFGRPSKQWTRWFDA